MSPLVPAEPRRSAIYIRIIPVLCCMALLASGCNNLGDDFFTPMTTEPTPVSETSTTTTELLATTTTVFVPDLTEPAAGWLASLRGVGPFRIGMSVEEAEAATGIVLEELDDNDPACSYLVLDPGTGLADQLRFMVRADEITRIDVDGPLVKTISGMGVGNTSDEVLGIYAEAIVVSPGDSGEANHDYLTFIPSDAADLDYRLRFEAIDGIVTTYRVGQLPEVEWVGRCQ